MKSATYRISVLISLWAKLMVQCVSQKVLLTAIDNKCFTNTPSSAVAALYDLSHEKWEKTGQVQSDVKYVSQHSRKLCDNFDCHESGLRWKTQNSLELGHINNLVMDRRWEDFPMYFTKHTPPSGGKRQFQFVGVISSDDFVIPFSLHSKCEAHVFICDRFTCDWIKLQAYNNTETVVTTCKNHYPNTTITSEFCFNSNWKYENVHLNNMFNYHKWSHFKFVKSGNELRFINETDDVLFKVKFAMNATKDVFVHSKLVNGMWKIHNFTYLYSESQGATFFKFKVVPGQQCLSMFMAMCQGCSITMIFFYYDDDEAKKQSVLDYRYFSNTMETWQHAMFCFNTPKEDLHLQVATHIETDQNTKAFWALSDIRTGRKDEFRYIAPDPATWSGKCQSLKTGLVLNKNAPNIDILENVCKEDQFGEDCYPCNKFKHGGCPERTKYCQLVTDSSGNTTPKCFCSIGYEGSNCQEPCSDYRYGPSCQRSCKNCRGGCTKDTKFGKCHWPGHCLGDYFGEKCDARLGIFLFANKPEINAGATKCQLSQTTFAGTGRRVQFYKFQFREEGEDEWKDVTKEPLEYNYIKPLTVRGLKPDSTYQVRVFGYDKEDDLKQLSILKDAIKIHSCTTRPHPKRLCTPLAYEKLQPSPPSPPNPVYF